MKKVNISSLIKVFLGVFFIGFSVLIFVLSQSTTRQQPIQVKPRAAENRICLPDNSGPRNCNDVAQYQNCGAGGEAAHCAKVSIGVQIPSGYGVQPVVNAECRGDTLVDPTANGCCRGTAGQDIATYGDAAFLEGCSCFGGKKAKINSITLTGADSGLCTVAGIRVNGSVQGFNPGFEVDIQNGSTSAIDIVITCKKKCDCTYVQDCGNGGKQECSGIKDSSATCKWDDSGDCQPACKGCVLPSPTPTNTPTPTTPANTPTPTPTTPPGVTPTPTPTPRNTPTPTPTTPPGVTPSPTPTATPTPTTPPNTPTPTSTPTPTPTNTPTPVPSNTPTPTATNTPTPTPTIVQTCGKTPCNDTTQPCTNGTQCVKANNGSYYCSMPQYVQACVYSPSYNSCCTAPTPTPTEVLIAQVTNTPAPTVAQVAQVARATTTPAPVIPSAGITPWFLLAAPAALLLIGLLF